MSGIILSFVASFVPASYAINAASGSFAYTGQDAFFEKSLPVVTVNTFAGSAIMALPFGG